MIHYIRFSNFYSFLEEQEINFVVPKRMPDTRGYVQSAFGPRLSRVIACYGANGAGKTNVLKVVDFLRRMVCASYGFHLEERLPFSPFLGAAGNEQPSTFEVVFELDEQLYRYS